MSEEETKTEETEERVEALETEAQSIEAIYEQAKTAVSAEAAKIGVTKEMIEEGGIIRRIASRQQHCNCRRWPNTESCSPT